MISVNVEKLLELCKREKKIYIYGDGKIGRVTRELLRENGVNLAGFVITNKSAATMLMDVPVISFDNLSADKNSVFIVCMNEKYRKHISEKLCIA